jgi:acetyl-CoA carboxylase carboxyl transferase subunit alpha
VIDRIIPEPEGGAQRDPKAAIASVGKTIEEMVAGLEGKSREKLIRDRRTKFLQMGSKGLAA